MPVHTKMTTPAWVEVFAPVSEEFATILTPAAIDFVVKLHRTFDGRRRELLSRRAEVQAELDRGWVPDFLPETKTVRQQAWTVAPFPATSSIVASKLPAPWTARWSSTPLTPGRKRTWPTSRSPTRLPGRGTSICRESNL